MRFLALLFTLLPYVATSEPREVDVELFLAVDVSRSMAPFELEIQRRGYANALTHPDVISAIESGLLGEIAITYVEWAGSWAQKTVVPWTTISSVQEAQAISSTLLKFQTVGMRRTSIGGVLDYAREDINKNNYIGLRRVIDVSGDGPNNEGPMVTRARDRAISDRIIINGLPLMTRDNRRRWYLENLDEYYQDCVIGGPGSFVIPVTDWNQFAAAVRQKLVLEIAGTVPERLWLAQNRPPADCLIGEKRREQREREWDGDF